MANPKPGSVVHVELASNDLAASRKFLKEVFGWKFKKNMMGPDMEYWTFEAPSGPMGGLMASMPERSAGTLNYLLVKSVDATVKKIKAKGGKILMDKQEIPKIGWCAIYEVPGGIMQAIFQPKM
ncbi:MAG: VOC family protein [Thermoplasmata archaeon]|nr:VOC family protein [Thermoplasmata archaeon]